MGLVEDADKFQREHSWAGFPVAVAYKAVEDRVPHLAALIAYYGFVSLFPLLLLMFSILGFALSDSPEVRDEIVQTALREFPGLGDTLRANISEFRGSAWAIAIGVLGTLYGGLGVMQAAQAGFNQIYGVPRHSQPNPIKGRLRGLALLALLGLGLVVSAGATMLASTTNEVSAELGTGLRWLIYAAGLTVAVALFTLAYQVLTATELKIRDVIVGGAITAAFWQLLQLVGGPYVAQRIEAAGALYGTFGVVLAALAWIYLQAFAFMLSAEINVVRSRRLWPRALLTPFTDDVDLTEADRRVYSAYASAAAFKGFETITIEFDDPQRDGRSAPAAP